MLRTNCGERIGQRKRTGKYLENVPIKIGMDTTFQFMLRLKASHMKILDL
jgi:hypothetical protein